MNAPPTRIAWLGWGLAVTSLALPAVGADIYGWRALLMSLACWPAVWSELLSARPNHGIDPSGWYMMLAAPTNAFIYLSPLLRYATSPRALLISSWFSIAAFIYIVGMLPVMGFDILSAGYYLWLVGSAAIAIACILRMRALISVPS